MLDAVNLEEDLLELAPFGSFPVWGVKEIQQTELPEHGQAIDVLSL